MPTPAGTRASGHPRGLQRARSLGSRPMTIDARGNSTAARQVPSPNFDARPAGTTVSLVVVHGISLPPGCFSGDDVMRLFTNRLDPKGHPSYAGIAVLRVSAHFLLRRDGELIQFVSCNARAWHAGVSAWSGRERCNDYSVGIELEGTDTKPYEDIQYLRLANLLRALRRRYPLAAVVGHSDVAPGRKTDPGPAFDWSRIARILRVPLLSRDRAGRLAASPNPEHGHAL